MVEMSKVRLVCIAIVLLVGSLSWRVSMAQLGGEQYFNETGFWVRGEFLIAYHGTPYSKELYGEPISTFFESGPNLWVQYFQKARFELHPDKPAGQRVQLTDLGEELYQLGAGTPIEDTSTDCRIFPETGYQVCRSFLEYFESRGGVAQFGYPISNSEILNGITVQYFQKARFEFRPEFPSGQRVVLSDLGYTYFIDLHENRIHLWPESGEGAIIEGPIRLKARAHPQEAFTGLGGAQTIRVIVQDQRLASVAGAQVVIEIKMPRGGFAPKYLSAVTDENGVATFENIPFSANRPGVVEIQVSARKDDLEPAKTVTSFYMWW